MKDFEKKWRWLPDPASSKELFDDVRVVLAAERTLDAFEIALAEREGADFANRLRSDVEREMPDV